MHVRAAPEWVRALYQGASMPLARTRVLADGISSHFQKFLPSMFSPHPSSPAVAAPPTPGPIYL
jgi:hypothetical protein